MRIRFLACSATVAATLMASSALVSDAYAQKRIMLNPSTEWAVSRVADQSMRGNDYCAMARRFNRDVILTIAKNQDAEMSLAMDFQRPVLTPRSILPVTLDPGAGQQRDYDVDPVSSKAFVVRLGQDATFLSALERTGLLRIEVNRKSYSFNLADIDSGSFRLNSCLAGIVEPAAGEEAYAGGPSYRQEIDALRQQLDGLRYENERLGNIIDDGARTIGGKVESDARMRSVELRLGILQKENAGLRKSLELVSASDVTSLELRIGELEQENRTLKSQLVSKNNLHDEQQVKTLRDENQRLRALLAKQELSQSLALQLKNQVETLEIEKIALEERLSVSESAVALDYVSEITKYKAENADLKTALEREKIDQGLIEGLRAEIEQASHENNMLREAQALSSSGAALPADISKLKMTIAELEASLEQKDIKLLEASEQAVHMEALKERNNKLEAELKEAFVAQNDSGAVYQQVADLEADNKRLKAELLQAVNVSKEEWFVKAAGNIASLKSENARLQQTINDHGIDLTVPVEGAQHTDWEQLRQENQALSERLLAQESINEKRKAKLLSEIKRLTLENEKLQKTQNVGFSEVSAVSPGEIEELWAENELLKLKISQSEDSSAEVQALKSKNTEISAALDKAVLDLSRYEETLAVIEKKLADVTREKEQALAAMQEQGGALETIATMQTKLDALEDENEKLKLRIIELEQAPSQVAALKRRIKELTNENEILQTNLDQAISDKHNAMETLSREYILLKRQEPLEQPLNKISYEVPPKPEPVMPEKSVKKTITDGADPVSAETLLGAQGSHPQLFAAALIEPAAGEEKKEAPKDDLRIEAQYEPPQNLLSADEGLSEAQRQERLMANEIEEGIPEPVLVEPKPDTQPDFMAPEPELVLEPPPEPDMDLEQAAEPKSLLPAEEQESFEEMLSDALEEELNASPSEAVPEPLPTVSPPEKVAEDPALEPSELLQQTPEDKVYEPRLAFGQALSDSDIVPHQYIEFIEPASGPEQAVYQWRAGEAYGSAEIKPLENIQLFETSVQSYLDKTKARCAGEFAVMSDQAAQSSFARSMTYEVACVTPGVSSSAALLFIAKDGEFAAIAHETSIDDLSAAMDIRDRLLRTISGS